MAARLPPSSASASRHRTLVTAIVVVGVTLLLAIPAMPLWALMGASRASVGTVDFGAASSASSCPSPGRAARDVTLAAPSFKLSTGDSMTVVYEFSVANTSLSSYNIRVNAPSLFGNFPLANGTTLQFYLTPRTFSLSNTSWTTPTQATKTKVMTGPVTFSGVHADMTSELVGVMATAAAGTVELAFRWMWSVQFASNGTTVSSPWSKLTSSLPNPSIFYPAPYVQLSSTTNKTVPIGHTFTAYLLGSIASTTFNSELEYASTGNVIRHTPTSTGPGNSTPVAVSVQMLPTTGTFGPSAMLDHVRNVCGALLYSIPIYSVYASSANVTIGVSPSSCGPIQFNGSSYHNGATAVVTPSASSLTASAPSCSGHTFQQWTWVEGVYTSTPTSATAAVTVSASGSLTATYT